MSFLLAIVDVLNGYNGTVFAYGQTSSGKTHTIEVSGMCIQACLGVYKYADFETLMLL